VVEQDDCVIHSNKIPPLIIVLYFNMTFYKRFPSWYNLNIVASGVKHHNSIKVVLMFSFSLRYT